MFKQKLLKIALFVFLLVFIAGSFSYAQHQRLLLLSEKLNLAPEQEKEIRDLQLNFEKEKIRLKADLKIVRLELEDLLIEDRPVKREVYRKIEQMGDLRVKLQKNRVDKRLAIKEILTPEQFEKLQTLKHKRLWREKRLEGRKKIGRPKLEKRMMLERLHNPLPEEEEFAPTRERMRMLEEESDL